MSADLLLLPDEALKLVLPLVPLQQRLSSCSLVSRRWHTVAAQATHRVDLQAAQPSSSQSALDWLSLHGQHVTSLRFLGFKLPVQTLACPNLLDLEVDYGAVQLGPSAADGLPGVLEGCTKLTRLVVQQCTILDARPGAVTDSLSRLVGLQHLNLLCPSSVDEVRLSAATLPSLRHLTHLSVRKLAAENVLQLGALTRLQELRWDARSPPAAMAGLVVPASLTALHFWSKDASMAAALLPLVPTGLRALQLNWSEGVVPDSLLSRIARLQCLTQLCVRAWHGAAADWPPVGPAYSALTASSSLVSLQLAAPFHAGVWPFVFPAARTLPHLTALWFDTDWTLPESLWAGDWVEADARWAWGADDLSRLVSSAPNLVEIWDMALQAGPHVSELRKLTALTSLDVHCVEHDLGLLGGVAAITQLRSLTAATMGHGDIAALSPLTSLTGLTSLAVTFAAATSENELDYFWQTQAGSSDPPLWLQLLERCLAEDPAAQPSALRSLAQQLAEQRALTSQQQQQLTDQQQQIAGLQQQLSAQEQTTAEQIADLQAQMQQLLLRLPQ